MNDIILYEKVPMTVFPIKILDFHQFPEDFCLHWHEHTEILYIKRGTLHLRCAENTLKATEGDCVIINENELHDGIGGECEFLCIYLSPALFEPKHYLFQTLVRDEALADIILRLAQEYPKSSHSGQLATKGLTFLMLSHLISNHTQQTFSEVTYRQYAKNLNIINDVVQYLEQNYSERITTASLARRFYLSEGHFCHVFKEVTGKTITGYINTLRIEKAITLLKNTDLSITDISMQCGFCDANYFTRTFKKYKGISPSSVRGRN
ncbi:MAG: AraC family transcriptional regulator [Clostridia bacterium]|nr:AraC family transcriptional regulator [Clostridia bacterium]